jgi:hypothetical protein
VEVTFLCQPKFSLVKVFIVPIYLVYGCSTPLTTLRASFLWHLGSDPELLDMIRATGEIQKEPAGNGHQNFLFSPS